MNNKARATSLVLKKEKTELKSLALSIRTAKNCLKETQRQKSVINDGNHRTQIIWGNLSPATLEHKISDLKFEYRHRHVAYCLVKGKKYEQIESRVKNKPNMDLISKYTKKLRDDIWISEEILLVNEKKLVLDEEDRNTLFGIRPVKLNCFYFGIDRSHCGSCWESSDEELHLLTTTKTLKEVKREFKRFVWNNYENMENRKYSSFYTDFFDSLKYKAGWDCLYSYQMGRSYCPEISGSMYEAEYDVIKELNPETVFSKEEYASILDCANHARELEEKRRKEEEKEQKARDKAQKEYDKELAAYEKEKKKYDDYVKLRKEFEGESVVIEEKKLTLKKPKLPAILDPKKRQSKAIKELGEMLEKLRNMGIAKKEVSNENR